jgi:glycine oxidase
MGARESLEGAERVPLRRRPSNLIRVMPAQGGASAIREPQSQRFDAAVIGAGVCGLSAAWHLARGGARVVVVDRDEPGRAATHQAAGMLAPVSEAEFGHEALLALNLAGAERWPGWAAELTAASGHEVGLRTHGTLEVARNGDEAEALDRLHAFRTRLGLPVERLLSSAARRLEPALAPTVRLALNVPDEHSVDPRVVAAALLAACTAAGVTVRTGAEVTGLVTEGGAAAGVTLRGGEELQAGVVVLAVGAWSGALPGLPEHAAVPVRPVKGQILRLRDPAGPGLLERMLRYEGGYIVPRGDGRYVLGATVEERGFDTTVTAGALHDLLRDAAELVPGVLELELEQASAGLRPGTPDNAPVIGAGALPGLVWATGHHRNGILLAPVTGDAVAALVLGEEPPVDLAPFAADRFGQVPA